MKILDSYKTIAKELIKESAWDRKFGQPLPTLQDVMNEAEVDDDKVIKYKKKDGEQGEMKASSAKTMPDDHPAKQAYNKMKGDDSGEKDSGGKLGGGDFERPGSDDEPEDPIGAAGDVPVGELPDRSGGDYDELDMEMAQDDLKYAKDDLEFAQEEGDEEEIAKAKEAVKKAYKAIDKLRGESIKESKEPTKPKVHPFKETYKKIGGK